MNRREFLEVSGAVTASGGLALASPPAVASVKSGKTNSYHVGVEYYRAPMPPMEMWDEDFAAIKKAGFDSVR
ncbi:MAG: twin-arginine translocation signal domain-containing protein, partial [Acidobacteriota bacterium]|nr:twin-arginine translocation signal domain-containing protein [Acidobacteriota bacterium]